MAEVKLKASKRDAVGKGGARRTRSEGKVPGVVYGHGMEPLPIEVDRREFLVALNTDAGLNVLLDLDLEGSSTLALTKELQRHPVRGTVLHADFIAVNRTEEVEVDVPLHLVGEAPGAREGGVLQHLLVSVAVKCRVTDVPEGVDVDVSGLAIGDSLRVEDLPVGESFEILTDPETVVASVTTPVSEEELEAMEAEAGVETETPDAELEEGADAEQDDAPEGEGDGGPDEAGS